MSKKRDAKKKKIRTFLKRVILIAVFGALIITGMTMTYAYSLLNGFGKDNIMAKRVETSEPVNILLLGVDAGDYESKSNNSPKRSDTMMLIRYMPEDNNVYMLSIPRDTKATINGHTSKINSAHAVGGTELALETVEKMLSLDINYYIKLDYEGFRKCIDAIGGIDVVIPRDMNYDADDISIHFKKGEKVHLDGQKAEEFVRWRKNNDGGGYAMGDLDRQETQQEFLVKVIEKLKTPSGIIRIPSLMKTISQYVKSNIAPMDMMRYALKLRGVDTTKISRETLSGKPDYIGGISYYIWDKDLKNEFLQNFKVYKSTSQSIDMVDKSKFEITILNSTGVSGHAAKYKEKLEKLGYTVVKTGNYPNKLSITKIDDYTLEELGNDISKDLAFGKVVKINQNAKEKEVTIILGTDSVK